MKRLKFLLKAFVSIGLLLFILSKADLDFIWNKILNIHIGFFAITIVLEIINIIFTTTTWNTLIKAKNYKVSFSTLLRYNLITKFFNTFLPSNIGGDVYRAYKLGKTINSKADALATVFMQRFSGLIALFLIAAVSILWIIKDVTQDIIIPLVIVATGMTFIGLLSFSKTLQKVFKKMFAHKIFDRIRSKLKKVHVAIYDYKNKKMAVANALFFAIFMHLSLLIKFYFIALALDIDIALKWFLIYMPIIRFILILPISINGIGVKEGAYVFFFGKAGLTSTESVAMSLFSYVYIVISAIIGAILFNKKEDIIDLEKDST